MQIVGKVVLSATHVKRQECDGPKEYKMCYPILDLKEDMFYTEDLVEGAQDDPSLGWAVYRTADYFNLDEDLLSGELSSYPKNGYFLTFDSLTTSQTDYLDAFKAAKGAFFGNGARSVVMDFAVYSQTLNYWVYVQLLFEFSISDQVIFSKSFRQFRSDIYETEQEKTF